MKSTSDLFKNRIIKKETAHDFEFQEVCVDLAKDFGKLVWTLPYKKGVTEFNLRKAGQIARQRKILKFNYLVGILNKL